MLHLSKDRDPDQSSFDRLLIWLDADREAAARKYEAIRRELIDFFGRHVGADAEDLADHTINVVIEKTPELAGAYTGNPKHYFFRVAHLKRLEYIRRQARRVLPRGDGGGTGDDKETDDFFDSLPVPQPSSSAAEKEMISACLHECLQKLRSEERKVFLLYYRKDGWAQLNYREELAASLGCSITALRLQIHRLKGRLRDCIRDCRRRNEDRLIFS
jgi:RNA polymerase sigma factor (sigma-70 family)